jgi:PAS domain S-box-containing protein
LGELVDREFLGFVHPDDRAPTRERLAQLAAGERVEGFVNRYRHRDGSYRSIEWRSFPEGTRIFAVARDVTERAAGEEALRASEKALAAAQARARMGSFEIDLATGQARWSKRMARLFRCEERPAGPDFERFLECVHPEDRDRLLAAHARLHAVGEPVAITYRRHPDLGPLLWLAARAEPATNGGGRKLLAGTVIDVTERVTAYQELRASEERARRAETRLRELFDHAALGIWRTDAAGRVLAANPAVVRMLGYDSEEELLGVDVPSAICREPAERLAAIERFRERGARDGIEVEWLRRDGTPITVRVTGRIVATAGEEEFETFVEDVTERRSLEEQLRRSQRLESLGRLAGGVANDFNNYLGVIVGYAGLLRDRLDEPGMRGWTDEIAFAAERAAGVTRQLLAFGRQQVVRAEPLDLGRLLAESGGLLRRLIGEELDFEVRVPPALDRVLADRVQLEQVIVNLVVDARDAMPEGGRLVLSAENLVLDAECVESHVEAAPGRYVVLMVEDTGCGMDAETVRRIFEPFFTTKPHGKGTGLGLATVYGIVRQGGGHVTVASEPGVGTIFRIHLPSVETAPAAALPAPGAEASADRAAAPGGGECVLLVEDEEPLRRMTAALLRKAGYDVLEAGDGATARALAAERAPQLLVTDVMLRGERGPDLADELSRARPGLAVLFVSGWADEEVLRGRALRRGESFLSKPFVGADLRRTVRALLDARRESAGRPPAGEEAWRFRVDLRRFTIDPRREPASLRPPRARGGAAPLSGRGPARPRQCGKTTLARQLAAGRGAGPRCRLLRPRVGRGFAPARPPRAGPRRGVGPGRARRDPGAAGSLRRAARARRSARPTGPLPAPRQRSSPARPRRGGVPRRPDRVRGAGRFRPR